MYLYDTEGNRYLDGCCGALVTNYGYDASEIAHAMAKQAEELTFVYRFHFSSPIAEELPPPGTAN